MYTSPTITLAFILLYDTLQRKIRLKNKYFFFLFKQNMIFRACIFCERDIRLRDKSRSAFTLLSYFFRRNDFMKLYVSIKQEKKKRNYLLTSSLFSKWISAKRKEIVSLIPFPPIFNLEVSLFSDHMLLYFITFQSFKRKK